MQAKYLFTITYLLICFIVSVPFNYATFQLLYTRDGIPAGADNTFHTYSILKILDTSSPLIGYSAFPTLITNNSNYYPSFFHLAVAAITKIANFNQESSITPEAVVQIEKSFMYAISLAGTGGFAILIKTILEKSIANKVKDNNTLFITNPRYRLMQLTVYVLAFSIFIFAVTPIIKTYNDGTYAQIFAMWFVFPYYLFLLVNRHWVLSALLLSVIASSHNVSFLMSLAATIPYLGSALLFQRVKQLKKGLIKFVLTFTVFAIPAIVLFYVPTTTSLISAEKPGNISDPWPLDIVISQLKPGLYYAGIICTTLLLLLSYRTFGWLSAWVVIYFTVFNLSSVIGARFARELSVVFGIVIAICIGYILFMSIMNGRKWLQSASIEFGDISQSSLKLFLIIGISACIIPLWYLYFIDRFQAESNPLVVKYLTDTINESNRFFLTSAQGEYNSKNSSLPVESNNHRILVFGHNPWLKVTTYGKFEILQVQSPDSAPILGERDREINDHLLDILTSPDTPSAACTIKNYDIDYVYISDTLPGRFYSEYQKNVYYKQLDLFQSIAQSPIFELEKELVGEVQEHIRIYSVNKTSVNTACKDMNSDLINH